MKKGGFKTQGKARLFVSTYFWARQENLHSFISAENAVCSNLPEEDFQGFTVRLPLS